MMQSTAVTNPELPLIPASQETERSENSGQENNNRNPYLLAGSIALTFASIALLSGAACQHWYNVSNNPNITDPKSVYSGIPSGALFGNLAGSMGFIWGLESLSVALLFGVMGFFNEDGCRGCSLFVGFSAITALLSGFLSILSLTAAIFGEISIAGAYAVRDNPDLFLKLYCPLFLGAATAGLTGVAYERGFARFFRSPVRSNEERAVVDAEIGVAAV